MKTGQSNQTEYSANTPIGDRSEDRPVGLSDTPRTDELAGWSGCELSYSERVSAGFARELERENARLRDVLIRLDALYRSELDDAPTRPSWLSDLLPNAEVRDGVSPFSPPSC